MTAPNGSVDDARWEPGMPVLDRQAVRTVDPGDAVPPSLAALRPRSVPETTPTPLRKHYVLLSAPVLVAGAIAITALEAGVPLSAPIVKACVLVAAPLLLATTLDAIVRIWRAAWAWMPVDRGRGIFRLAWVAAAIVGLVVLLAAAAVVLVA